MDEYGYRLLKSIALLEPKDRRVKAGKVSSEEGLGKEGREASHMLQEGSKQTIGISRTTETQASSKARKD